MIINFMRITCLPTGRHLFPQKMGKEFDNLNRRKCYCLVSITHHTTKITPFGEK
jgi:hypothetical protein